MITAICEIHDICTGIKKIRLIENTDAAMTAFEEEMDELMDILGYRITFFDAEIPEYRDALLVYRWMDAHEHLEIDRPL